MLKVKDATPVLVSRAVVYLSLFNYDERFLQMSPRSAHVYGQQVYVHPVIQANKVHRACLIDMQYIERLHCFN